MPNGKLIYIKVFEKNVCSSEVKKVHGKLRRLKRNPIPNRVGEMENQGNRNERLKEGKNNMEDVK